MARRLRTVLGIGVAVLLGIGIGLGRGLGGLPGDGPVSTCDDPLPWQQAEVAVGERAAVAGPVAAASFEPEIGGAPTFLNLGNAHPDPDRFDVVVYEDVRDRFEQPPEDLAGTVVCVRGEVRERDGVPQIILDAPVLLSPHDG